MSSNFIPKIAYEWIVTLSKGDEIVLTESQFAFYKSQLQEKDMSQIFFIDQHLNPVYVVSSFSRPANVIRRKYPCKTCLSSGHIPGGEWCTDCEGSGVSLPK